MSSHVNTAADANGPIRNSFGSLQLRFAFVLHSLLPSGRCGKCQVSTPGIYAAVQEISIEAIYSQTLNPHCTTTSPGALVEAWSR